MAVYKPRRAERPLWDFPDGLYRREVAAYELAEALGWRFVPETVRAPRRPARRRDRCSDSWTPTSSSTTSPCWRTSSHHAALKRMATFDVIANNADRKGGHCLLDADGQLWGIDHGLCFHAEPKLRTVIWDFAGRAAARRRTGATCSSSPARGLPASLTSLLHRDERRALEAACRAGCCGMGHLPEPRHGHHYPWPLV